MHLGPSQSLHEPIHKLRQIGRRLTVGPLLVNLTLERVGLDAKAIGGGVWGQGTGAYTG